MAEYIQKDTIRDELSTFETFAFLWRYTKNHRGTFFLCSGLVFIGGMLGAVSASRFGILIEKLIDPKAVIQTFDYAILAALEMAAILFIFAGRRGLSINALHAIFNLRNALFAQMKKLPMSYYDREPAGRIVTRLTHDVDTLETFYSGSLSRLLSVFLTATTVIIIMFQNTWWLGAVSAALMLPAIIVVWAFRNHSHNLYRQYSRTSSAIT